MNLVTLVTSVSEIEAIQDVRKYRQTIIPQSSRFPYYLYLEPNHWSWSAILFTDEKYYLVPLQVILQPQDYPEYYI